MGDYQIELYTAASNVITESGSNVEEELGNKANSDHTHDNIMKYVVLEDGKFKIWEYDTGIYRTHSNIAFTKIYGKTGTGSDTAESLKLMIMSVDNIIIIRKSINSDATNCVWKGTTCQSQGMSIITQTYQDDTWTFDQQQFMLVLPNTSTPDGSNEILYRNGSYGIWQKIPNYVKTINSIEPDETGNADLSSKVLFKDNATEFVPTEDYHPATKKYVDEHSSSLDLSAGQEGQFLVSDGNGGVAFASLTLSEEGKY